MCAALVLFACLGLGQPAFAVGAPPVAIDQAVTTPEDAPLAITLTATDLESDPLTFAVVAPPASGVLSGTPPDLTYTPNSDFDGAGFLCVSRRTMGRAIA